ncbi:SDR family NAD(P)-dependent oxidoreductase [Streptomyces broussonetiae]|uniref:SDR family NAD(P)-dependent oxidoreductase n=2 Tax=Streptomyces broussonetiae TaxID=2686304 RepID=A0A6I6NIR3_9ACTN|nr:SDR family NAD(P)-dependent oxidoreductase [Streptomyces broussonetiae]
MRIQGATALVTGANRGLGQVMARLLLQHGAQRVYGGARDPRSVVEPGVIPVRLDITDSAQVAAAAGTCSDVTLLGNNSGVLTDSPLLAAPDLDAARTEMEVNYFGTLAMCRAFAPLLTDNSPGAIVNVLSIASWFTNPAMGSYSASKAAAWALTNGIRGELHDTGVLVVGVHCGYLDTTWPRMSPVPRTPRKRSPSRPFPSTRPLDFGIHQIAHRTLKAASPGSKVTPHLRIGSPTSLGTAWEPYLGTIRVHVEEPGGRLVSGQRLNLGSSRGMCSSASSGRSVQPSGHCRTEPQLRLKSASPRTASKELPPGRTASWKKTMPVNVAPSKTACSLPKPVPMKETLSPPSLTSSGETPRNDQILWAGTTGAPPA